MSTTRPARPRAVANRTGATATRHGGVYDARRRGGGARWRRGLLVHVHAGAAFLGGRAQEVPEQEEADRPAAAHSDGRLRDRTEGCAVRPSPLRYLLRRVRGEKKDHPGFVLLRLFARDCFAGYGSGSKNNMLGTNNSPRPFAASQGAVASIVVYDSVMRRELSSSNQRSILVAHRIAMRLCCTT